MGQALGRNLLAILVGAVLLAALALGLEWYFRWEHRKLEERFAGPPLSVRASADPLLLYEAVPNCSPEFNSQGYRDVEREQARSAACRVAVVGDSIALGHGVAVPEMFSNRLQELLGQRLRPQPEVLNIAVSGYSMRQELRLLERDVTPFAPDLVIWAYCLNDPAHPLYHDANGELGRLFHRPRSFLLHRLARGVFLLRERILSWGLRDEFHTILHEVYWPEVQADLQRLAHWSQEHATPVLFVVFPVFEVGRVREAPDYALEPERYSLTWLHARLVQEAQAVGLETVDMLERYQGRPVRELMLAPHDPWHPGALGHALAAQELLERIESRGLLVGCGGGE